MEESKFKEKTKEKYRENEMKRRENKRKERFGNNKEATMKARKK